MPNRLALAKRLGILAGFAALGLASSLFALRLMAFVDWSRWTWCHVACWESGPCDPPWYATAAILACLCFPLFAHLVAGARAGTTGWTLRKLLRTILASLAATIAFHALMRLALGA